MRIGIDARFIDIKMGIGRYLSELIEGLANTDHQNSYVIFASPKAELQSLPTNFQIVRVNIPWYGLVEQLVWPFILYKHQLNLIHFPHFNVPILYRRKFVVTIHDLILFNFPSTKATTLNKLIYTLKEIGYRLVIGSAVRRSQKILTVSQFTATDICKKFGVSMNKITVTFLASHWSEENGDGTKQPNFLYVGNAYPHKNLESMLNAFVEFRRDHQDFTITLVGHDDFFYRRLTASYQSTNGVIFKFDLDDFQLKILYQQSYCYIFPSFYEGFGLPGLEAMSLGLPVLSSDKTSLPEIYGDAALYFDPSKSSDLLNQMKLIAADEQLRLQLVEKGLRQSRKYSWARLVEQTKAVYETAQK